MHSYTVKELELTNNTNYLMNFLKNVQNILSIEFRYCTFNDDEKTISIFEFLKNKQSLKILLMKKTFLEFVDEQHVFEKFGILNNLEKISLGIQKKSIPFLINSMKNFKKLISLELRLHSNRYEQKNENLENLGKELAEKISLRILRITINNFSNEEVQNFLKNIKNMKNLEAFSFGFTYNNFIWEKLCECIEILKLIDFQIKTSSLIPVKSIEILSKCLEKKNLKVLKLIFNSEENFMYYYAKILENNKNIENLKLKFQWITYNTIFGFSSKLIQLKNLNKINLTNLELDNLIMKQICSSLTDNILKKINFSFNSIGNEVSTDIFKILTEKCEILTINNNIINNNFIFDVILLTNVKNLKINENGHKFSQIIKVLDILCSNFLKIEKITIDFKLETNLNIKNKINEIINQKLEKVKEKNNFLKVIKIFFNNDLFILRNNLDSKKKNIENFKNLLKRNFVDSNFSDCKIIF